MESRIDGKWWVIALLVASALLSFWLFRPGQDDNPLAIVQPEEIRLVEGPFAGDTTNVDMMLKNVSKRNIEVLRVTTSCGCTRVVTTGNKEFVTPIAIAPGKAIPWRASISSAQSGPNIVVVTFLVREGSRESTIISRIELDVRVPWMAVPDRVVLQPKSDETSGGGRYVIELYEDAGLFPVKISSVLCSNPKLLTTIHASVQSQIDGLVCRNKIILTVDPDFAHEHSGQVEALVTIVPSDTTRHKTLYIPVTGRLRNPEYTLKPARLALSVRQLPVTRTVRCMIASEVDDDVCLGDVPDGIRAELKKLHKGMYEVKIVCSQALPRKNMSIPILRNRDQQEACVLFLYMIP